VQSTLRVEQPKQGTSSDRVRWLSHGLPSRDPRRDPDDLSAIRRSDLGADHDLA
jgi:hypothetical protein